MYFKKEISIVVPVHNEERILKKQVESLCRDVSENVSQDFEIILVENGSRDRTIDVAREIARKNNSVKVLTLKPANYGMAVREGMLQSTGKYIFQFDIDYWDINFSRMCFALLSFDYDMIIGTKNSSLSIDRRDLLRRFISQVFRLFLHILFKLRVSDTHGIKFWRNSDRLRKIIAECRPANHMFDTELVIKVQYAGFNLMELPVEIRELRKSSIPIIARIPTAIKELIELWFNV